jgi:osmotically-inducible protein OsmY
MGWLARLFGHHDDKPAEAVADATGGAAGGAATATAEVPPERRGLNGEYDQSGLAKRVAKAFDDAGVEDAPHLYVAQTGSTVVFKGNVKTQAILDSLAQIAASVDGATAVDTSQVHIQ